MSKDVKYAAQSMQPKFNYNEDKKEIESTFKDHIFHREWNVAQP